ncbi:hypothetical protein IWQ60_008676 [Tieghemiomyces parasiticus]|uniref:Dihydropteridine reductase n=1 Tax=Tieghemiomyces parasiticus TaxID=78921 RepID=A0A9W7ZRY4_9FUNG|nr:hypothetical protein IWQ60_008676 [Tieghemiomyces parasiticus]
MSRVIVYGGNGALGATLVSLFKARSWQVTSIGLAPNPHADKNVLVKPNLPLPTAGQQVLETLQRTSDLPVHAVLCVAGGWEGGSIQSDQALASAEHMWQQSVQTSLIAAQIAARHLRPGGLLTLTGAEAAAAGPTPGMIGYGMAKAAVHHLTASLAAPGAGLPDRVSVNAILPVTLDTPANRGAMPDADRSTWTPLSEVAEGLFAWASDPTKRPPSGSLVKILTKDHQTTFQ